MSDFWTAVDDYVEGLFEPPDPALDEALRASDAAGLPDIQITANQGHFLQTVGRKKYDGFAIALCTMPTPP